MMPSKPLTVGVVGVTGAVGQEIIVVMANRKFPVSELKLFASARSAGKPMSTPFGELKIREFTLEDARACDVVFLAVSGDFALEWVPKLTENDGPLVIDNSSAYRCAAARGSMRTLAPAAPAAPAAPRASNPRAAPTPAATTIACRS